MAFCVKCGRKIEDGNEYCAECLNVPEKKNELNNSAEENINAPEEDKKNKGKFVIAAIILILAVLIIAVIIKNSGWKTNSEGINAAISASFDADGVAYIPLMNGKVVKIDDDVRAAYITPDRKHIVVEQKDNTLYVTDSQLKNKKEVTGECKANFIGSYAIPHDEGFLYEESDASIHRYLFSDESDVSLKTDDNWEHMLVSDAGFNVSYMADDGSVYLLKGDSDESEKLGEYGEDGQILFVSDDGRKVYWINYSSSDSNIYAWVDGDRSKVGSIQSDEDTYMKINEKQTYGVILNPSTNVIYIVSANEDSIKVKLPDDVASSDIYTDNGNVENDENASFSGIYVKTDGGNLYYIDKKGEKEKVLSDLRTYYIHDGYIYYIDTDDDFNTAKLSAGKLTKENKVSGDASQLLTSDSEYIIFIKDFESLINATLYAYKLGEEPVKVASEAIPILDGWGTDGKTIYYYKDPEGIDDASGYTAELYKYTYGSKEAEKITSDAILPSGIDSGYKDSVISN